MKDDPDAQNKHSNHSIEQKVVQLPAAVAGGVGNAKAIGQ